MVEAPVLEELVFRSAFSASLVPLVAAARGQDPGWQARLRGGMATVLLVILLLVPLGYAVINVGDTLFQAGLMLVGIAATGTALAFIGRGQAIPSTVTWGFGLLTTVAFALAHLANYEALPHHPLVTLLVVPQLISGLLFLAVTQRFGLRAAMLVHAAGNGLQFLPPVAAWLALIGGTNLS
ncbi:hypothetical protein [Deinococcus multiflagellatus]|uniref:hypothetical protein n=1 Tax=Deinococcus multiflagellatus TaxID=1656887 RepID=UPI0036D2CBA1